MRRSLVLTTILGAMLAVGPATAQGTTIAVLPFEDGGSYGQDKASFEALRTSLQSSLVTELSRASGAMARSVRR